MIREAPPPEIKSAADALAVSLNETGRVDLALIAKALHASEEDARDALDGAIWLDPAGDIWRTSATICRAMSSRSWKMPGSRRQMTSVTKNVEALERVQPAPLTRVLSASSAARLGCCKHLPCLSCRGD